MTRQRRPSVTRGEGLALRNSSTKGLGSTKSLRSSVTTSDDCNSSPSSLNLLQVNDHWSREFTVTSDLTNTTNPKKKVNFSTINVRFYKTIVGDSPSCSGGPPLALGWEIQEELGINNISVDVYESCQPSTRKKDWEILLPRPDREERLLDAGFTRQDLAKATAATARARQLQTTTILNLRFMKVQELVEEMKLKTIPKTSRQHPKWLYNEWETSVAQKKCTRPLFRWIAEEQTKIQGRRNPNGKGGLRGSGVRDSNVAFRMSARAIASLRHQASSSFPNGKPKWTPEELERLKKEPAFGIVEINKNTITPTSYEYEEKGESKEEEEPAATPFAKVDFVYHESPIHKAGIQQGDLLYSFGPLVNTNCVNKGELGRQIQRIVAAAASNEEIRIGVIQRSGATHSKGASSMKDSGLGGQEFKTTVFPQAYEQGPGNLGWLISPYNN